MVGARGGEGRRRRSSEGGWENGREVRPLEGGGVREVWFCWPFCRPGQEWFPGVQD